MRSLVLLVLLGACDKTTEPVEDSGHTHGHTHTDTDTDVTAAACGGEVVDEYVAGIGKDGVNGQVHLAIMSADPAPPDKGTNTWEILVTALDGTALATGDVVVTPFMPEHNHGTTPATFLGAADGEGIWMITEVDLMMPGVWEITIDYDDPSAGIDDSALFRFCIEG